MIVSERDDVRSNMQLLCDNNCAQCKIECAFKNMHPVLHPSQFLRADAFLPHRNLPKVEFLGRRMPKIIVSKKAYSQIYHIVDVAKKEVSWLGACSKIGDDFLIEEVFLFEQICYSDKTEMMGEGIAKKWQEFLLRKDGLDLCNRIIFWGHSHVWGGTNPSERDEIQMENIFSRSGHPSFVRGIMNKNGRMEFTIYLYDEGLKIADAQWFIQDLIDESMRSEIEREYNLLVREADYEVIVRNIKEDEKKKRSKSKKKRRH
ncbi:MAG: hypothetical protein WC788_05365 [Candidatus Paceibacterota bacterium]